MPLTVLENPIELSNFTAGWVAKAEEAGVPPNGLLKAVNLLPDTVTGTVVTRSGFKRATAGFPSGYRIYTLRPYTDKNGTRYIMAVLSNGASGANNVRVYAINMANMALTQVSPAGKAWNSSNGYHWGVVVDSIYYGGSNGEAIYSWDGTTWTSDVSTPNFPVFGSAERPADYAFKAGEVVKYTYTVNGNNRTDAFQVKVDQPGFLDPEKHKVGAYDGIRYEDWDTTNKTYLPGERVSRKVGGYWRSYKALQTHEPMASNRPGDGTGTGKEAWQKFWTPVKLPAPVDVDGRLVRRWWVEVPDAPRTRVAAWHGNRLWARDDGRNRRQTAIYSRLSKVGEAQYSAAGLKKDTLIGSAGNPDWDPSDWRTGGAPGAGFQPFETEEGDPIQGFISMGYYLVVLKRNSTHVVAGTNAETWTVRQLAPTGTVGEQSFAEHEGYTYFISSDGFHRTDGTMVELVPGSEKIAHWLHEVVKWSDSGTGIVMRSHDNVIWLSIPTSGSDNPNITLVYEPISESFWPQDFGMLDAVVQKCQGIDRMFFSQPTKTADIATYEWQSTPHQSGSTRTIAGVTSDNLCLNPGFEATNQWTEPLLWLRTTVGGPNNPADNKVDIKASAEAARDGKYGMHAMNKRQAGSTAGPYDGWEGAYWLSTDSGAGTHTMSIFARRPHWQRAGETQNGLGIPFSVRPEEAPNVKFLIGETVLNPQSWTPHGNGWWKIDVTFAGSLSIRKHGVLIPPDRGVHLDMCRLRPSAQADGWFDGYHGYGLTDYMPGTGGTAFLQQYDHPEAQTTDDPGFEAYQPRAFGWLAQTAWLPFGGVREERRVRRIWALIKGRGKAGVRTFLNYRTYDNTQNATAADIPEGETTAYIEGRLPNPLESYAVSFQVEGDSAPAALLAVSCDTEPLRIRYGG
jgi:hypothetical protein